MRIALRTAMVIALLLLVSTVASAQTETMSPEEIVAATYDAVNAGDVEAYIALFAEDAVATIGPWQTLTGIDEMRPFIQENVDAGAQMEYEILSVEDGTVTVRSSITEEGYDFPLVAMEEFVVEDGKIVFNAWNPTEETMTLLMAPQFGNDILNGVYGMLLEGVFFATEDDPVETIFNMVGSFVADGEGNITEGTRTLNFGGDIQSDTIDGTYTVYEDGTAAITLNAYQDGTLAAVEELTCFITIDGSQYECVMTGISVVDDSGTVDLPLIGSAHGLRLMQ